MSSATTVLMTGANRGIGKGLVATYLAIAQTTVIAAVRNASSAQSLYDLSKAPESKLVVIEMDLADTESISQGIQSLDTQHSISSLDIVIANAALLAPSPNLAESGREDLQPFVDVNVYGNLELFKASASLLRKSIATPKFVYMSSAAGSFQGMSNMLPLVGYSASKALGNFLMKWLALETKDIVIFSMHPGIVATDSNKHDLQALKEQGIDLTSLVIPLESSVNAIKSVIDKASLETTHGRFLGPDGNDIP